MRGYEARLWGLGFRLIAGVDEAGRGSLAGPVVAAAVILPPRFKIEGLADSKKLRSSRREELFEEIQANALAMGLGIAEAETIDALNVLGASLLAMERAITALHPPPDYLLIDGNHLPSSPFPKAALPKGEDQSPAIAAASILAKVTRDRLMAIYHRMFPQYGFLRHKGYGTRDHMEALRRYGPSPIHRRTFRGVREHVEDSRQSSVLGLQESARAGATGVFNLLRTDD